MLANKRRDTTTELAVRRALHARGLRYRVDFAPLPSMRRRRADIVFTRARLAIFIDGCFWHGCPQHATHPKRNAEYWRPKLARNIERDAETTRALEAFDWVVLRFWEHEEPHEVAHRIIDVLLDRSTGSADESARRGSTGGFKSLAPSERAKER